MGVGREKISRWTSRGELSASLTSSSSHHGGGGGTSIHSSSQYQRDTPLTAWHGQICRAADLTARQRPLNRNLWAKPSNKSTVFREDGESAGGSKQLVDYSILETIFFNNFLNIFIHCIKLYFTFYIHLDMLFIHNASLILYLVFMSRFIVLWFYCLSVKSDRWYSQPTQLNTLPEKFNLIESKNNITK